MITIGLLLTACSPGSPEQLPAPTLAASDTPSPTATLTPTATPIIEPVLPPSQASAELAVEPPDFNQPASAPGEADAPFDLIDAHAVYAYYRQQEGPSMWANDADFASAMQSYSEALSEQGINLRQVTAEGLTYSLLTNSNQILLNFKDGVLSDLDPGRWSTDSTPEWIDVGSQVELFIGDGGHAYIAKVDNDGNVIAFLNPIGATKDNLNQQWIEVQDGQSVMIWDEQKGWIENPLYSIPESYDPIDRIETLADGRTVAIATPDNPGDPALLRVAQLEVGDGEFNESTKWVPYVPDVGYNYIYLKNTNERLDRYNAEADAWIKSLPIPELTMPIIDKNGQPMPLGYIGDIQLTDQLGFVFSGIWGGCRYSGAEAAIFVPTPTGDYQVYAFAYSNNPKQYQYLGIYLGRELDTVALARGEYDLTRFALETDTKRVIGETIETADILAEYMINKYPVGGQFSFWLTENFTVDDINYRPSHIKFLRIIHGEPPDDDLFFPHLSGIIIPQQLEDMFNY